MSDKNFTNLDVLAAKTAQSIVSDALKAIANSDSGKRTKAAEAVDNLVTKALGVIQENGVYAGMLFLLARTRKEDQKIAFVVCQQLLEALKCLPFSLSTWPEHKSAEQVLTFYADQVCNELDKLFLIKELYEQTLIYARYGAKAAK
jgi:hypothetical protein